VSPPTPPPVRCTNSPFACASASPSAISSSTLPAMVRAAVTIIGSMVA
jgi:hypothetical protein